MEVPCHAKLQSSVYHGSILDKTSQGRAQATFSRLSWDRSRHFKFYDRQNTRCIFPPPMPDTAYGPILYHPRFNNDRRFIAVGKAMSCHRLLLIPNAALPEPSVSWTTMLPEIAPEVAVVGQALLKFTMVPGVPLTTLWGQHLWRWW